MTGAVGDDPEVMVLARSADVAAARQRARELAEQIGLGGVAQTKVLTAASELGRNTVLHGGGGRMLIERLPDTGRGPGLQLTFVDDGPGIADVQLALTEGWSTSAGLGLGLPGTRRLMHDFELTSTPGRGTTVRVAMWAR